MTDRKAKLEKALAPSLPNDTIRFADMAWGIQSHANRLAPLHAAFLDAVKALEEVISSDADYHTHAPGVSRLKNCVFVARKALSKIDEALEGGK